MKYPVDRSSYSEEMHNKRFCVAYAYLLPKDKAISRIGLLSQEAFSRKSVTVFRRTRDAGILVLDLNLPFAEGFISDNFAHLNFLRV